MRVLSTEQPTLHLAPPGAGLPKVELFFANLIFRWGLWRSDHDRAVSAFASLRREILTLTKDCSVEAGTRRVLIRRLPGLEDSSRFWSVFMTLDHLRIVNDEIARTVTLLLAGQVPSQPASTAAVKPQEVGPEVREAFAAACARLEAAVGDRTSLATATRHRHPWFGPLDARAWHFMAGFHMRLHRQQLERIRAGLTSRAA